MSFLERWRLLSPLLDEVLDLEPGDRSSWIEALRSRDPERAADVEQLLEEQRAIEDEAFLHGAASRPASSLPAAGDVVGAYTLLTPIGRGGMGTVWLARRSDGRFDRPAAVKFLSAALPGSGQARFRREGAILGRLAHPNIAQLLDAGVTADGHPYLVLEYVDGAPVDVYCDAHGLDTDGRVRLLLDVIAAVAHAHASLIVHRDLKPSNVLVRTDGRVKLLDFGIAKLLVDEEGGTTALTREGGASMTPEYAAPEQVTGDAVTAGADVYALGVLAYVLLTGTHPTSGASHTPASVIKSIVDVEPRRASEVTARGTAGRLQGDLDTILAKALKKAAAERYPTAAALGDDLQRYLRHEPVHARPDTLGYRARKFARRNRVAVALGAAAVLATAAGVTGTLLQASAARAERDYAVQQLARAEAINDLDNFVLYDAAPGGKAFTVNDLLADAERIVRRRKGDDVNSVDMLISIGRHYQNGDQDAKARAVLQQAYDASRRLADRSTRGRAACSLASALSRGAGGQPRADALYVEGIAELDNGPRFVLDRIFCLQRGSEVAGEAGQTHEGVARAEEALRLIEEAPFRSDVAALTAETRLAEALRIDGRAREAASVFERAAPRLAALGRDDTQSAGTLYNNWALTLHELGRPLEAERVFSRAIGIGRDTHGEDAVSPMLLANYARVLRDLHRLDEAADYAERAYDKALRAGDDIVVNQSLIVRSTIYRERGDFPRAAQMLDDVEPRLRQHLPPTHIAFGSITSERAVLAQARGDLASASTLIDRAMAMIQASMKAGGLGAEYLAVALTRRAGIRLQLGRATEAADDARRAVGLVEASIAPRQRSINLGRAYAALGRAEQAVGHTDAATAAFRSAVDHLRETLGDDNSETMTVRQLASATQTARR